MNSSDAKQIIGSNALVTVGNITDVPAKIDTGADSSSIWASDLNVTPDGALQFKLFAPGCPYYNGQVHETTQYKVGVVRSATGEEQTRYRVHLPITLAGRRIKVYFTLADRSRNNFPILIGKRTLRGKFIVDVSQSAIPSPKNPRTPGLNRELRADPQAFHNKHMKGANS